MKNITDRTREVMAAVFGIDAALIPENAAPGILGQWDSFGHVTLILALEEEFQIRFSDDEMVDIQDLNTIVSVLSEKVSANNE